MKFEFEIADEDIQKIFSDKVNLLTDTSNRKLKNLLDEQISKCLYEEIEKSDFKEMIKTSIALKAEDAINQAIDTKLPGWMQRKVKEVLGAINLLKIKE